MPAGEYIVYEVPLRTFSASPTSGLPAERRGTFLGFMDKVRPHPVGNRTCVSLPHPLYLMLRGTNGVSMTSNHGLLP